MKNQRFEIADADRDWMSKFGWESVDDVLACGSGDVAAVSHSSDVVRVAIDPSFGGPSAVFVKRYLYKHRKQRIKQIFRGSLWGKSRARWEYEFLCEMCRRGVPTVRPIAYGERRRGALLHASFVITDGSKGGRSLDLFALDRLQNHGQSPSQWKDLSMGLARVIRQMHDAGVRHGGLYWRNILVHPLEKNSFRFTFLDPDTHGQLRSGPLPDVHIMADLSEFIASAISLGLRGGMLRFAKGYFGGDTVSTTQRHLIKRIIEQAKLLARAERKRMAVAESIDWLRQRVTREHLPSSEIDSIEQFFEKLTSSTVGADRRFSTKKTIHFSFSKDDSASDTLDRRVMMEGDRFSEIPPGESKPDLLIRSDPQTWLSVLAGRPEAYARVRAGKLTMKGDTRLLPTLIDSFDGGCMIGTKGQEESPSTNQPTSQRFPHT